MACRHLLGGACTCRGASGSGGIGVRGASGSGGHREEIRCQFIILARTVDMPTILIEGSISMHVPGL